MKRDENKQTLGQAIQKMISDLGMEEKILSVKAEELFSEMMGNYIMKHVKSVAINKRILYLKISTPELKHELMYGKSKIIQHINSEIGKEYILDVKFQ
ncbi:MAG TPA: DUF721 domain-containing protein [Moheibacter sp.]|nr:DUF721 domain-containing protein [Moheibacter sp.]